MGTIRGLITLLLMVSFIAMVVWLMSSRFKHRYDDAARLPLEDDTPSPQGDRTEEEQLS